MDSQQAPLWDFPGRNTGVGCHSLLQGIFLTQGSNLGLLHWRQTLYHLSHQGSPAVQCSWGQMTVLGLLHIFLFSKKQLLELKTLSSLYGMCSVHYTGLCILSYFLFFLNSCSSSWSQTLGKGNGFPPCVVTSDVVNDILFLQEQVQLPACCRSRSCPWEWINVTQKSILKIFIINSLYERGSPNDS